MEVTETNGVAVLTHNGHSLDLSPEQIQAMAKMEISQLRQLLRAMRIPITSDVTDAAKTSVNDAIRELQKHIYQIPGAIKSFLEARDATDDGSNDSHSAK